VPRPTIVMVSGAAPGLGKTSLSRRIADALRIEDRRVELFEEADILEREEFAEVMRSFRSTGSAPADLLLDAARRYAATARRSDERLFVQDMLFPYLPSLLAWGHDDGDIEAFFAALLAVCDGIDLLQLHLVGDPTRSLARAVRREDPPWLEWMLAKVATYADADGPVTDFDSLVRYFEAATDRTSRLLAAAPWPVVVLDADHGEAAVVEEALRALALRLT